MSVPSEEEESEFHKQKTLHLLYSVLLDTLYEFVKNRRGGGLEELIKS